MTFTYTSRPSPQHSQVMDRLYRTQRHFYDFTRKYYLFGRDMLLAGLNVPDGGRALEIGCGTGRNLVKAARKNPQALFYGVDISREMLLSASAAAHRARVGFRVITELGDAETFDACTKFRLKGFDRVFFSYCLSMVPGWRLAMALAVTQMSDKGSLHIVDFGQMEKWPRFARSAMRRWLASFHVTPRADLIEEAERLARIHKLDVSTRKIAGGYAWLVVLSRPGTSKEFKKDQA